MFSVESFHSFEFAIEMVAIPRDICGSCFPGAVVRYVRPPNVVGTVYGLVFIHS